MKETSEPYIINNEELTIIQVGSGGRRGGQWGPRPHLGFYKLLYIDLDI
jgi:hypothetical protein